MGSLEPQEMTYFDLAPVRVTENFDSPAPPDAIFGVLADHRRWPEWIGMGVTSMEPTSAPTSGVGSTRTLTIGRGALRVQEQFIAWEEPAVWAFTGVGSRPSAFRKLVEGFWLESLDTGGTRITYRMGCELPVLLKPATVPFKAIWRRLIRVALPNLSVEAVRRHGAE